MLALLPLAVFTAEDEQIFTVTLDLPVQACKNASLSLANVAWYVLHIGGCRNMKLPWLIVAARLRGGKFLR